MVDTQKVPFVYCFLDTNILLHFQTFNEVDWPKLLNAKQVCLVLAPVVLRELDKHKDDYNNERRRKRARMLLSKLKSLLEAETHTDQFPQVRQQVSLLALTDEPMIDWTTERLDQSVNDDRLVASILDFRRTTPEPVLLVADDFPLRLKAKSRGIQILSAEGLIRYIEPPSPEEAKIRVLEQQIQEITDRFPKLRLGFFENGKVEDEITRSIENAWQWETPDQYIRRTIRQKKAALSQMLARADSIVGKDDVESFRKEYETYLSKLEPALKMEFVKDLHPRYKIELSLINEGTAPAHEVGVHIVFPRSSSVITLSKLDSEVIIDVAMPDEPAIPEWALDSTARFIQGIGSLQLSSLLSVANTFRTINPSLYTPNVFAPRKDTYTIKDFPFGENIIDKVFNKLSHFRRIPIDPLLVYLPPSAQTGFTIAYTIFADEMPNPITGKLKVRWEQKI